MKWTLMLTTLVAVGGRLETSEAANPGFKARITKSGIDYANDVAVKAITKVASTITFPDISGKASGVSYWVNNIRVTSFTPPASVIGLVPGQGLQWTASGAGAQVEGSFRYKASIIKGSGSFTAAISGVGFDLSIDVGVDASGRPSISTRKCSSSVGSVNIKFHGSIAWLLNLLKGQVEKTIRNALPTQMCQLATKAVNTDAERKLADIPITVAFDKFLLDYSMLQAPLFSAAYMETFHKGEIYWKTTPSEHAPFPAPPMPETGATDRMLYLWVSDFMFNTLAYAAQTNRYLQYNITAPDLPASARGFLNTTCAGVIPTCIGSLIPAIGQKYPNSLVDLRLFNGIAPVMDVSSAGVVVNTSGVIELYVHKPGTNDGEVFLVSFRANLTFQTDVSIIDSVIHAKISYLKLNLKTARSEVGPISDQFIDFLIKNALDLYLIPKLNDYGSKGITLPFPKEVSIKNAAIILAQDTIVIATDVAYTPSEQRDVDGALKFVPYDSIGDVKIDNKNIGDVKIGNDNIDDVTIGDDNINATRV
ncbi:lipopolysaccharide-binding protein-like isoform X2 [Dreissena polymorpha]|nr:lipopolysaccharide-binding protein-like isoform X2 [Dreissena polymorpha]XP_052230038.1 lipopolysaccharide-binding protein-like isoform X2 [Dreissena polymorpha]